MIVHFINTVVVINWVLGKYIYPTFQDTNNTIVTIEQLNGDINWKNKQTILQINTLNVVLENRTLHSLLILPYILLSCLICDCKETVNVDFCERVNSLFWYLRLVIYDYSIEVASVSSWWALSLSLYIYIHHNINFWVTEWSQTSELNVDNWNGSQFIPCVLWHSPAINVSG